ncbi:antigen 5 like allergen Cul n 1-like isoform X3 [Drosophila biarmipes]|nr:antigen 5 like allergen Cul n 1-like isoform X3 [Drosophila biarmipes]
MIPRLLLPLMLLLTLASGYNYCNNKTHRCVMQNMEHFMCRLKKFPAYGGQAKLHDIVPDTKNFEEIVLDLLNGLRNLFASGKLKTRRNKRFAKARRMRKLIWDKELAYLARNHASTMSFMRTECRSTRRFPYVGEIPAVVVPRKKLSVKQICRRAFQRMFDEYLNVTDPEALLHAFDAVR